MLEGDQRFGRGKGHWEGWREGAISQPPQDGRKKRSGGKSRDTGRKTIKNHFQSKRVKRMVRRECFQK